MAELAAKILSNNTGYASNKSNITDLINSKKVYKKEDIIMQLVVIDSCYSTNFSKRYFGFSDLAEAIFENFGDNKAAIKNGFLSKLNTKELNYKNDFFENKYGRTKTIFNLDGDSIVKVKNARAFSLISKYAYFLTDYNFPIYDSLVKKVFPFVTAEIGSVNFTKNLPENNFNSFLKQMKKLNETTNINDYDKLDNLMWLAGKIKEGNFSLILNEASYINLVEYIVDKNYLKSKNELKDDALKKFNKQFNNLIRSYVYKNYNSIEKCFSPDQKSFIEFCVNLFD